MFITTNNISLPRLDLVASYSLMKASVKALPEELRPAGWNSLARYQTNMGFRRTSVILYNFHDWLCT
jgi:hypothetical protein